MAPHYLLIKIFPLLKAISRLFLFSMNEILLLLLLCVGVVCVRQFTHARTHDSVGDKSDRTNNEIGAKF